MALLYSGITCHPHPSDQHVVHYITIITNIFGEIPQFLTNLYDFIKYIMQYNRIWVMKKIQLASSYTWQLMRLIQHFYLNVTINHYWVFVITSDCDPMWILVKWWGRNMLLVTFYNNCMWKIHSYNFCGAWRKSNVTNYCSQKLISNNITFERRKITSSVSFPAGRSLQLLPSYSIIQIKVCSTNWQNRSPSISLMESNCCHKYSFFEFTLSEFAIYFNKWQAKSDP